MIIFNLTSFEKFDGEFVREWKSVMDVQRNLGYSKGNISSCCTGRYKYAYNFVWKYK